MSSTKETDQQIQQLSLLEQNIQNTTLQKQGFHLQLLELESAIKELDQSDEAYKLVANIMIRGDKHTLRQELLEKKEVIDLRIKSLEKQETKLKEKAQELQKVVLGNIENGK